MKKKEDNIEKIFAQQLELLGLTYENNQNEYFKTFIEDQSLYQKFKKTAMQLEKYLQIDDSFYCDILQGFMGSKQLFSYKGVELIQAWIAYKIKSTFEFKAGIKDILSVVIKIFNQKKITLKRCVDQIAKKEVVQQKLFLAWRGSHKDKVENFEKAITNSNYFIEFNSLKKQLIKKAEQIKQVKQQKVKQIKQEVLQKQQQQIKVQVIQNTETIDYSLVQLEKQGQLILDQYDQLIPYKNLVELQIQKYFLHYFIKIYQQNPNHNKNFLQKCNKYHPLQLKTIQSIKLQLQEQKRQISEVNFKRLIQLQKQVQNTNDQRKMQQNNETIVSKYQQIFNIWNSIKQELNILNIFLLRHLIQNTQQSIKHIKDKNILFLIGPSGAGKTTIILRLLNYQLIQTTISELPTLAPKYRLKPQHSQLITSPQAKSTTKYIFSAQINPQYVSERQIEEQDKVFLVKQQLYLCDTPGFFDTSGVVVDIANGVGMINAVKCAKTVKPVIVISASMVGQKFDGIKQIGKIVSDLFHQYRKKQQGFSTQFIFNKFAKNQQFNRLEPGLVSILSNLSANDQSDGKYVRFLQILHEKLKKKKNILRFDPFNIKVKDIIGQLQQNPIQNPDKIFKYSFSSKSVLTLKNYFQNKLNIIVNLLNADINHACYHIKQMKNLLQIVPNQDFKNDYQSLIKKICNMTQEYFLRFKLILHEDVLKNEATISQIEQLKYIYDILKSFKALNSFPQIEVYQQEDLLNLIANVSQLLENTYRQYKFTNNKQVQFKKIIKIIKCLSQNFNSQLITTLNKYIQNNYENTRIQIQRLVESNQFNSQFKQLHQKYQNLCTYSELVDETSKVNRSTTVINEKYQFLKQQLQRLLLNIKGIFQNMTLNRKKQLKDNIQSLIKYYNILESITSLNISAKIKQQNLKNTIIDQIKTLIKYSSQKCEQIINLKELKIQNMIILKTNLDYLEIINKFIKSKEQCQLIIKNINHLIKKSLQLEIYNLEDITLSINKNKEISSKIINLDSTLFKIKNYSQIIEFAGKGTIKEMQETFFDEFRLFIQNLISKISKVKFGIKTILKLDEVTNLIKKIKELRYLKCIKQNFTPQQLDFFQKFPQKKCFQKLIQPYKEIRQCFSVSGCTIKITKKLLNELSSFIQYDYHLSKMMSNRDYTTNIIPAKQQHYQKLIKMFMDQLKRQITVNLSEISVTNQAEHIYNCQKSSLIKFKKTFNLYSYTLKDDNILRQLNRLQREQQFTKTYHQIINILQKNQKILLESFYQHQNGKQFQNSLQKIRRFCYEMKEFDGQLGQQNNFNEIITMINNEYSKKQMELSNKLIYIFTESSVDFKQLRQLFTNNQGNPQIIQEITNKIKRYDQNFCQQIDGMKKYSEDLLFQNDNLNYIKLVKTAYIFYKEIQSIIENKLQEKCLTLNIEYFKSSLDTFVQHYQHLYKKIMENIFKLKYKRIPENIESFFTNLQQLISQLLPEDYENIKNSISQIPFTNDFNIKWPNLKDKSITYRICKINQILRQQIQTNFSKVINISSKSSIKYYDCLQEEQKRQYLKQLTEKFAKEIDIYQQKAKEGILQQEKLRQFFETIPDQQIKSKLIHEFSQTKNRIISQKEQIEILLNKQIDNKNFDEAVKIYKRISKNDQSKYKNKIVSIIVNDFGLIINGQIDKKQIIQSYKKNCQKYQEKPNLKQFVEDYGRLKKQFQNQIEEQIKKAIQFNKENLEVMDSESFQQKISQNNQMIINAYIFLMEQKTLTFQGLFSQIEDYFKHIITQFQKERQKNSTNIYSEIQELQKQIKNIYYLTLIIKPIVNQCTYNKSTIQKYRNNSQIARFILNFIENKQETMKCLQKLAGQILKVYIQISNFSFSQFIQRTVSSTNIKEQIVKYFQQVGQKINFLLKIQQTYNQYELYKFNIDNNTKQISNLQQFKRNINRELDIAFLQIQKLQNKPQEKLSIRFNLILNFCQICKNKVKSQKDLLNFIKKISDNLQVRLQKLIHKYEGQIQTFNKISMKKSKGLSLASKSDKLTNSQLQFCSEPTNIEKAEQIITILIIMEEMQGKIGLHQEQIKQTTQKIIQNIKKNGYFFKLIIKQMKSKQHIAQIKNLLQKYFEFKQINGIQARQVKKKSISEFLDELKEKNKNFKHDIKFLTQDYEEFQNHFNATIQRYQMNTSEQTIKAITNEIHESKSKCGKSQIIGKICALHSILKKNQSKQSIFKLHPGQFVGIVVLLHNLQSQQQGIKNKLLQILPGEGKSIVLAITACFLALKGYNVYQICQTQYLLKRDQHLFKRLFQTLNISQHIKYNLLKQLCQDIVKTNLFKGSVRQLIQSQILKDLSNQNKQLKQQLGMFLKYISKPQEKTVIILDQIDTLFSQNFQGRVYEPTLSITDEGNNNQIQNIYKFIYKRSKTQYLTFQSLQKQQIYKKLIAKYKSVEIIIKNQILAMLKDIHDQRKINQCYQAIKKKEDQKDFIGYHQCFAYLKINNQGFINCQKLKNNLKLFIKIGMFSYSELLKNFGKIIGFSGSLQSLTEMNKQILQNKYKIKTIYYFPSVFCKRQLSEQKKLIQSQSMSSFFKPIIEQINLHFQDDSKKAMLILAKNNQDIYDMCQLLSNFIINQSDFTRLNINHLYGNERYEDVQMKIDRITQDNTITFAVKQYAKGIDYKDYSLSKGLYVIQTYLPEDQEEYDHVRGRTARAGRPGVFKLIIPYQEIKDIKDGLNMFQNNISDIWKKNQRKKQFLRKKSLENSLFLHNKTLDSYKNGNYKQFFQHINLASKPKKQQKLIILGFQGALNHLQQYKNWLVKTLQKYEKCIDFNSLNVELRYQVCFYGNYTCYSPFYPLIKTSKICKMPELINEVKNMTRLERNKKQSKNEGQSIELFFKYISQLSQKEEIASCFVWSHQKNYNWNSFKQTNQYRNSLKNQLLMNKQFNIKFQMKTCKQLLKIIKSKNIPMNFIGLSLQVAYKRQMQQYSSIFFKDKSLLFSQLHFGKKMNEFFLWKMKQVVPQLKNKEFQKEII